METWTLYRERLILLSAMSMIRRALGMTQKEFATLLQVSKSHLTFLESVTTGEEERAYYSECQGKKIMLPEFLFALCDFEENKENCQKKSMETLVNAVRNFSIPEYMYVVHVIEAIVKCQRDWSRGAVLAEKMFYYISAYKTGKWYQRNFDGSERDDEQEIADTGCSPTDKDYYLDAHLKVLALNELVEKEKLEAGIELFYDVEIPKGQDPFSLWHQEIQLQLKDHMEHVVNTPLVLRHTISELYYGQGISKKEIADMLKISVRRVTKFISLFQTEREIMELEQRMEERMVQVNKLQMELYSDFFNEREMKGGSNN